MTPRLPIYEQLQQLPLFQGMSHSQINNIVAYTRLGFLKFAAEKTVVAENEPCNHLWMLMQGQLKAVSRAEANSYTVEEPLPDRQLLQPERIFGLSQHFTKSFLAVTDVELMRIEKSQLMKLLDDHEIVRLNLLNIVSTQSQRQSRMPWRTRPDKIRQRFKLFVEQRCLRPAGPTTLHIKMETLANEIGESRLNVSRMLNAMSDEGLLSFSRGIITINALERC